MDEETGLVYYGYRYLDAAQGRWPSRDPIGEMGGTNCYEFCLNAVYFYYDHLSMDPVPLDFRDFPSNRATREEAEKKIFPKEQHPGGIPTWARRLLDRGCIGLCSIYQGNMIPSKPNPEDEEGVKCFNTREEAESEGKNCPACTVPAYFTKQGKYKDGKKPKIVVPATGRIPNDSVEALDGKNGTDFNYVTYMPSTQTYAWMNHREYNSQAGSLNAAMAGVPLKDRPQVIVVSGHEPNYDKYKDKMWCVKCKIKSN